MQDPVHFASESDSVEVCRRTHGSAFTAHAICLVIGALMAAVMLWGLYLVRVIPDQIALGDVAKVVPSFFKQQRINAWRLTDYPSVYPKNHARLSDEEWLWLGNSQLHSINQPTDGDRTAPAVASELCGFPVFGLSLPNATLVEQLAVIEWALPRRNPSWVILPICYDDLRGDEYRPGWPALAADDNGFQSRLNQHPACAQLSRQIAEEEAPSSVDLQSTSVGGQSSILGSRFFAESLQEKSEQWLDSFASGKSAVWRDRNEMWARVLAETYHLRNLAFGITPQTKRKMIPVRFDKNMAALSEILGMFGGSRARLLVYICPLRFDIEPPYIIDDYRAWKEQVKAAVQRSGNCFYDLDSLVPGEDWGTFGERLDFMHFQGGGHRLLGAAVADAVRQRCAEQPR